MIKKLLFFCAIFLIFPIFVFANNIELKQVEEDKILQSLIQIFKNNWINNTTSNDFSLTEQSILTIFEKQIQKHVFNSILGEVGKEGLGWALRVCAVVLEPNAGVMLGEFEKLTVDAAKTYAMDWLLQNEIKIGNGNLDFIYKTIDGKFESGFFPYIIAYKPISKSSGEVAMSIYSAETIKAPGQTLAYQWEGGIDEIPPFILEIKGKVNKTDLGAYEWSRGPEFNFIFDQPVPRFNFKEPTIADKIKSQLEKMGNIIEAALDIGKGTIKKTVGVAQSAWGKITSLLTLIKKLGGGSLADAPVLSSEDVSSDEIAINITSAYENIKQSLSTFLDDLRESSAPRVIIKDNQDQLDDIKEEMDILAQKIAELQQLADSLKAPPFEAAVVEEEEPEIKMSVEKKTNPPKIYSSVGGGSHSAPKPSYCQIDDVSVPLADKIIFSQVGWYGNEESSNNEWIELKNISAEEIDIERWQVLDKDMQIKSIFPAGSIQPNQTFLMERTDDSSVSERPANLIYSGALNNEDEILYLFNSDCGLEDRTANILAVVSEADNGSIEIPDDILVETTSGDEPSNRILFNEIAWMGTKDSPSNEWIELFNPNEESVDLSGWDISGINIDLFSTPTPSISALGYFLLERTDDDSVKDVKADRIYTGALNDSGAILELRDKNGKLSDKADFSSGWPAGDKEDRISMERTDNGEWRNNNLLIVNGQDAEGNPIYGTPKAKNSVSRGPHSIIKDVIVPAGKISIIEPGTVFKFQNNSSKIIVEGVLKAAGTEQSKIIFTSAKENPAPGDWRQIWFKESSKDSELSSVIIEYGGADPAGTPCSPDMAAVKIENTDISISNAVIKNNLGRGALLIDSSSKIENSEISNNAACIAGNNEYERSGIEADGGHPAIRGSVFINNNVALSLNESYGSIIENNIFEGNKTPVFLNSSSALLSGNSAENNSKNGIWITGDISEASHWQKDLPYIISPLLDVSPNASLIIDAGTVIKFDNKYSGLRAKGRLVVNGEEGNEVIFTSISENPAPGSWDKIEIAPTSQGSKISYAIIEYAGGGYGTPCSPDMAGLKINGTDVELNNLLIRNTQYRGAYLIDYPSELINPIFENIVPCVCDSYSYGGQDIESITAVVSSSSD